MNEPSHPAPGRQPIAPLAPDILITEPRWSEIADAQDIARSAAHLAWAHCWPGDWPLAARQDHIRRPPDATYALSIELCNDTRIQQLNRDFRHKDRPTNVLSFPSGDLDQPPPGPHLAHDEAEPIYLGDVALALQTMLREARQKHIPPTQHMAHLIVHAMLHLLGWDHADDAEATRMEGLEIEILRKMRIANPYEARQGHTDAPY